MLNIFKKKEKKVEFSASATDLNMSGDLTLDEEYSLLIKQYSESLKDKLTSREIISKFKVKDKTLEKILTRWIAELVQNSKIDLILTGTNSNGDYVFLKGDLFERTLKSKLNPAGDLLNENETYKLLQDISGSKDVNVAVLRSETERKMKPLVRFTDGSRNMPIMLNLCNFKIPETDVIIDDEMLKKFDLNIAVSENESKAVKKMMFSQTTKKGADNSPEDVISTAFTLLLKESGKLILNKSELTKTRAYRIFFSSLDFQDIVKLSKSIYQYTPTTFNVDSPTGGSSDQYISFYPENWLDVDILREQIEKEGEQSPAMNFDELISKNYSFLSDTEIETLKVIINGKNIRLSATGTKPSSVKKEERELAKEAQAEQSKIDTKITEQEKISTMMVEKNSTESKTVKESKLKERNEKKKKKTSPMSKSNDKDKRKQKMEPSEPLKFLDSMIVNENNKENKKVSEFEKNDEIVSESLKIQKIDLNQLDKNEKHFLIRILDATVIESGYYSHDGNDQSFTVFLTKIETSNLFQIKTEGSDIVIKRSADCSEQIFSDLRHEIDEGFFAEEDLQNKELAQTDSSEEDQLSMQDVVMSEHEAFSDIEEKQDELDNSTQIDSDEQETSFILSDETFEQSKETEEKNENPETIVENTDGQEQDDYDSLKDMLLGNLISQEEETMSEEEPVPEQNETEENLDNTDFIITKNNSTESDDENTHPDEVYEIIKNNFNSSKEEKDKEPLAVTPSDSSDVDGTEEIIKNTASVENEIPLTDTSANDEKNTDAEEPEEEGLLDGKIISVLTDDEETWLKIEMMSKMLGFELRDGLAYRPDIAIFDDSYKHLEPIARNSGAMIMQLDHFMTRIGLSK